MADDLIVTDPGEEGRHAIGADPLWNESWYFDWASDDGSIGGFTRVGYVPNEQRAWFWLYLFTPDGLVAIRDHDVPLPEKPDVMHLRGEQLWVWYTAETPLQHWHFYVETYGVRVPAGRDLLDGEVGERVPVAIELDFEAHAPAAYWPQLRTLGMDSRVASDRYEQVGRWRGELSVGDSTYEVDAWGERDHSWGTRDWWGVPWVWSAWQLVPPGGGGPIAYNPTRPQVPGLDFVAGVNWRGEAPAAVTRFDVEVAYAPRRWPEAVTFEVADDSGATETVRGTCLDAAVLPMPARDGRFTRMVRALTIFEDSQGARGSGFVEFNQPHSGPFAVPEEER